MARAFKYAVECGRLGYESGIIDKKDMAVASTNLVDTPFWHRRNTKLPSRVSPPWDKAGSFSHISLLLLRGACRFIFPFHKLQFSVHDVMCQYYIRQPVFLTLQLSL